LIEYFTPLTLGEQLQGTLSDEDVAEVWLATKSEAISKVSRTTGGAKGTEAHCPDVKEVEKTFWLSSPDDWVINKKTKRIIMLEFKRDSDTPETYYSDMHSISESQHTPILEGLNALAGEWGWVTEVLPLVAGQRSVREKEWLEVMKTFGTSTEDSFTELGRVCRVALREPMHLCTYLSEEGGDREAARSETPTLLTYTLRCVSFVEVEVYRL
jgi:hypothetical protein